jgi:Flp pilus assembly protein TadD
MMNHHFFDRWTIVAVTLGICLSGCASTGEAGKTSWLNLPSPWATVRGSTKGSPKGASPSAIAKKAKKQSASPADESITLAVLRGKNHERAGEYDKARKLYEELYERHPGDPQLAHRLGVVADVQRRHEEAEHYLQITLQHDPRNAEALCDLGYCYFLQGQLSKAESALTKAVILEPDSARYRNNLGLVLGHLGRPEEALVHFRKAGSEADALYNLAFIYAAQDRVSEAKECFQQALNADPTHRPAREALASFSDYEDLPEHMRETDMLVDSRTRWVPYVEGENDSTEIAQTAATTVTSRDVSRVTRALHEDSRGMLNRNMQSQRNDAPVQ